MNSLEQYLKPPTNNQEEELYIEEGEGERIEEENEYIQNRENGNDNGEDFIPYQQEANIQNSKNMKILKNNLQYEDDNNDIVQGINSINNKETKNINKKKLENMIIII